MTESFDFEQALEDLQSGKDLNGILMLLIKQQLTEAALKAELDTHLKHTDSELIGCEIFIISNN